MSLLWITALIAMTAAICCAMTGTFLVLRRESLVGEGLGHAVLPGIVLAFLLTGDRGSPALLVGAAVTGLVMFLLVQLIERARVIPPDASLGLVFSTLFALGVLFTSQWLSGTYFHAHNIVEGSLALAPLDRLVLHGRDLGPRALWTLGTLLLLISGFLLLFQKQMELLVLDRSLAQELGLGTAWVRLLWMFLVALTSVAAFEVAGTILVVALMITPAATAALWVNGIQRTVLVAAILGAVSALLGCALAFELDVPPAPPIASLAGLFFLASLLASPRYGWGARARRSSFQTSRAEVRLLLERIAATRGVEAASSSLVLSGEERGRVEADLGWTRQHLERVLARARSAGGPRRHAGHH